MEGASEDKGELARLVSKATMRTFQKKMILLINMEDSIGGLMRHLCPFRLTALALSSFKY